MDRLTPRRDQWYLDLKSDRSFMVIDFDGEEGLIEIQDFDGELEEIVFEEWEDMELEEIEAPEDWTGPLDELEADDLGYEES